jgi:HEPN domain-containing protein
LGESKNITADYIKNKIENVTLEEEKQENNNFNRWFLLLIPIIIGLIYLIYKKYFKKPKKILEIPEKKIKKLTDYRKEAKKMIAEAEKLFKNKKEKDAYEKVSQAIRYYFSNKLGIKKEITNTDLLKLLKRKKSKDYKKIKTCLDLCALVEFAKYKANKKYFNKIFSIAKNIVV